MTIDGGLNYGDRLGIDYLYDSKIQNHKGLQEGDPIALWDSERLLGLLAATDPVVRRSGLATSKPTSHATAQPRSPFQRVTCTRCGLVPHPHQLPPIYVRGADYGSGRDPR